MATIVLNAGRRAAFGGLVDGLAVGVAQQNREAVCLAVLKRQLQSVVSGVPPAHVESLERRELRISALQVSGWYCSCG